MGLRVVAFAWVFFTFFLNLHCRENTASKEFVNSRSQETSESQKLSKLELRKKLRSEYYSNSFVALGYSNARKKMYSVIDNDHGVVECVYSGVEVLNPVGNEITFPYPINTEHVVPQSIFSKREPIRGDLHNLVPTYHVWNNARGHKAFREIEDSKAEFWLIDQSKRRLMPLQNRDLHSELIESNGGAFEVPEKIKGNIARIVLYFFNMYPRYLRQMRNVASLETLKSWHEEDPVDEEERQRNRMIEKFQGNKNPFVSNPDLVNKLW